MASEEVAMRRRYWAILPALGWICAACAANAQTPVADHAKAPRAAANAQTQAAANAKAPVAANAQTRVAANNAETNEYVQDFAGASDTSSPAASAQEIENQEVIPDYPPGCCSVQPK
jgi:hypothetical protein